MIRKLVSRSGLFAAYLNTVKCIQPHKRTTAFCKRLLSVLFPLSERRDGFEQRLPVYFVDAAGFVDHPGLGPHDDADEQLVDDAREQAVEF